MRAFITISLLIFIGLLVLLASEPACGAPYHKDPIIEPDNAWYVGKGGDFRTIADAVASASTGDVIYVWPGTYTEDFTVSTRVWITAIGKHSATLIGTITLGVDGVEVQGFKLKPTGTNTPVDAGAYIYTLRDCEVECDTWEVGRDTTYSYNCNFYPTADSGWSVSGANAIWHIEDSEFGIDIPIEASGDGGIIVDSGATLTMWSVDAYTDGAAAGTPLFICQTDTGTVDGKIFLQNCRMINNTGPVIYATDTANVSIRHSYLECGHATSPAVQIAGSSTLIGAYSIFKSSTYDVGVHLQTEGASALRFCNFIGSLWADSTSVGEKTEGAVEIYGVQNITVTAKEAVADTYNTAVSYLYGLGRIALPGGQDLRPIVDGGGDLGTENTAFDSIFTDHIMIDDGIIWNLHTIAEGDSVDFFMILDAADTTFKVFNTTSNAWEVIEDITD